MKKALILIDIQRDYFPGGAYPLKGMNKAGKQAQKLLSKFRGEGNEVIHIQHISKNQKAPFFKPGTEGIEIHPLVKPLKGERLFVKHFPNSFRDTGLDAYLKERGIRSLTIAGAMTNMCVDSTVRAGFDLGFVMEIAEKGCAARGLMGSRLIHLISIKTLGSRFARIR